VRWVKLAARLFFVGLPWSIPTAVTNLTTGGRRALPSYAPLPPTGHLPTPPIHQVSHGCDYARSEVGRVRFEHAVAVLDWAAELASDKSKEGQGGAGGARLDVVV